MKYCPVTRRMFLRGAGGYMLAIPFLGSLAGRAEAQTAPNMRFAMMLGQLGRDMSQWYPNLADSQLQQMPGGAFVRALADIPKPISYSINNGFNPILNKLSLIRGLDCMSTNGMHNSSVPTTGSSLTPSGESGFGYSIDCVLEESPKFYTTAPMVGGIRTCTDSKQSYSEFASFSYTSKVKRGQVLGTDWSPSALYNRLLNPQSTQAMAMRNARIRSATDLVSDNFKQVINSRSIASADKIRLDSYMSYISEIHNQMAAPIRSCNEVGAPPSLSVISELHKQMLKLEVAALACGTTKIVMHAITHAAESAPPLWHDHAHGGEYTINGSTGRSYLSEYTKFSMDLVAYFLTELDKVQEANGTLLDNTLFIYGNEDGTGSHEHVDLPVLVAGAKGKLNTGYFIDYRQRPFHLMTNPRDRAKLFVGRPYNNMLVTAFKSLGLSENDYQKFGRLGFGGYGNPFNKLDSHYSPFLGSHVNDPLPFLYKG